MKKENIRGSIFSNASPDFVLDGKRGGCVNVDETLDILDLISESYVFEFTRESLYSSMYRPVHFTVFIKKKYAKHTFRKYIYQTANGSVCFDYNFKTDDEKVENIKFTNIELTKRNLREIYGEYSDAETLLLASLL